PIAPSPSLFRILKSPSVPPSMSFLPGGTTAGSLASSSGETTRVDPREFQDSSSTGSGVASSGTPRSLPEGGGDDGPGLELEGRWSMHSSRFRSLPARTLVFLGIPWSPRVVKGILGSAVFPGFAHPAWDSKAILNRV